MNRRSAPQGSDPRGGSLCGHRITDEWVEEVLAVVESIPPGKVLAYGDIAELLGSGGPRSVGRVMSQHGGGVPWWRVIKAVGSPPECHDQRATREWIAERTPLRPNGKVDMKAARWDGRSDGGAVGPR
jgi:alkylated DNA nucleotide flippase Atl1